MTAIMREDIVNDSHPGAHKPSVGDGIRSSRQLVPETSNDNYIHVCGM